MLELIIGLVGWLVYGFVITRLVRRWLFERRISDTQAAFLTASRSSIVFLYGAIVVAINAGGITSGVIVLFWLSVFVTVIGTWGLRWLMPDLRQAIGRDRLRQRGHDHEDDRRG